MNRGCDRPPTVAALAAALLSASMVLAAPKDNWADHYLRGVDELKKGHCMTAITEIAKALGYKAHASKYSLTHGMHGIGYFPHYQLARAYACQKQYKLAIDALGKCESEGVYKGDDLKRLRGEYERELQKRSEQPASAPEPVSAERELLSLAANALKEGRLTGARELALEALDKEPGSADAKALLKQVESAIQAKSRAEAERLLKNGREALSKGDVDGAERIAKQVLALDPGSKEAVSLQEEVLRAKQMVLLRRATAALKEMHWEEARRLAKQADALLTGSEEARKILKEIEIDQAVEMSLARASQKKRRGDLDGARSELEGSLRQFPRRQELRRALSELKRLQARTARSELENNPAVGAVVRGPAAPQTADSSHPNGIGRASGAYEDAGIPHVLAACLIRGIRAYHTGHYRQAIDTLTTCKSQDAGLRRFYEGASSFTLYLLSDREDLAAKREAIERFRQATAAGFEPEADLFLPELLETYRDSERVAEHAMGRGARESAPAPGDAQK